MRKILICFFFQSFYKNNYNLSHIILIWEKNIFYLSRYMYKIRFTEPVTTPSCGVEDFSVNEAMYNILKDRPDGKKNREEWKNAYIFGKLYPLNSYQNRICV